MAGGQFLTSVTNVEGLSFQVVDTANDAVTFSLTAPVGVDMLAGHLTLPPWALATCYRW